MHIPAAKRLGKKCQHIEGIKTSERCYRQLAELCPEPLFIQCRGKFVLLNQAAAQFYGAVSSEELVGRSILDFVVSDHQFEVEERLRSLGEPDEIYDSEQQWLRLDGTILAAAVTMMPCVYGGKPAVQVVLRSKSDREIDSIELQAAQSISVNQRLQDEIAERQRVEAELCQKKERQLEALLNNIPDIAWLKDRDGRFIAVNEPFGKACGISPENLVGKTDYDAWSPVLAQKYRDDDAEVIVSQERKCFEEPLADRDGKITWIETIKTPIFNHLGEVVGTTGIARDVTQRRQLEVDLRQSEQRLSLALSATRTGIWEWDITTNQTFWSDMVFKLVGREPGSCESNYQNWLNMIHPEDRERADLCVKQAVESGNRLNLDYRVVLPDGTVRWLTCIGEVVHYDRGRPIKMTGNSTDITARVQIETALRELTHQLQQQNAQLAEVSRLKSEFLANMSHELRTPLTSILGFSGVLLQQHYGSLTLKQNQYLSLIHASGEHLLALINDLLDLVKIEAGKLDLHIGAVSLIDLCEAALQMVEVRALAKQQQLSLELPVACELIAVDRQRILQVLLNYLSNAIKFTPEGGTITLSTRLAFHAEMEAHNLPGETINSSRQSTSSSQFVVLSVTDTGIGIPLEQQHLLFQMFQQIDGQLNRSYAGTGLGLALTKRLVELHGGQVSFVSMPGLGSIFSAWLPLQ